MNEEKVYLLLVEDDPDILELLDTTLQFSDYRVVTAVNGKQALEIIEKEHPGIVIADIMMPQVDGFGLVHRLRINPETRNIPVVFITATYITSEDRELAYQIGVTQIIQKPVDIGAFLETINELLKGQPRVSLQSLDEIKFYQGYRQNLEAKLEQTVRQIAREEHALASDANDQNLQVSYRHSIRERDEINHLLEEIQKQLERINKVG